MSLKFNIIDIKPEYLEIMKYCDIKQELSESYKGDLNQEYIAEQWIYVNIYREKCKALIICTHLLGLSISKDIIYNGFTYKSKTSLEREVITYLSDVIISTELEKELKYIKDRMRHDIYHALILSLIKLDLINIIKENSIMNGGLEDDIFESFDIKYE